MGLQCPGELPALIVSGDGGRYLEPRDPVHDEGIHVVQQYHLQPPACLVYHGEQLLESLPGCE